MYLHRIVLATESKRSLDRIKSVLGDKSYNSLTAKTTKRVNELAQLAVDAYRSKVPIDGGELRDSNIKLELATPQSGIASVLVSGKHTSVKTGNVTQSDLLAQLLDIGTSPVGKDYKRSRVSAAINPYTPLAARSATKGWIRSARQAFASARRVK